MLLNEGGNVVPGAVQMKKIEFPMVMANLKKFLPKGINLYPIGSAGHKEVSSDIDALIDAKELMTAFPAKELKLSRKALEDYFKEQGLFAARTGVSVHVGVPIGDTDKLVQVDLMAVDNAKAAQPLHTHDYSDPNMKGGTLHGMWADLANMSSVEGHNSVMMSPYKGLVDRETKELITSDKDAIAKVIIGPTATAADMGNPQRVLAALKQYPEKYKAIKDKYFPDEGTRDWFRQSMSKLDAIEEEYTLDEGLGDWIEKKMDQLLGNNDNHISPDRVATLRKSAPTDLPPDVAEKLVSDFLAKKENEAALARAAEAQRTSVEKITPYLKFFVGKFINRWKSMPTRDKQRIYKDLANGVYKLLMFILNALLKSKR